jgi:hypothetical protein
VFVGPAIPDDADADYADSGGYVAFAWNYQLGASEDSKTFTITLQVMDEQGQWSVLLSRTVKLVKAP